MTHHSKLQIFPSSSPYALPPSLLGAMAVLASALDERTALDRAIERRQADLAEARSQQAAADRGLSDLDVKLALETDTARAARLEDLIAKTRAAGSEAREQAARIERTIAALVNRGPALDAAVKQARAAFETERAGFAMVARENLSAELRQALQVVAPILAQMAALKAVGVLTFTELPDMQVANPVHRDPPLLNGLKLQLASGDIIDLDADWRAHPAAAELADLLEPLRLAKQRAAGHRPFAAPAPQQDYQVNPQNRLAGEHNAAADRREAERLAADPPKSRWAGQSHVVQYHRDAGMPIPR